MTRLQLMIKTIEAAAKCSRKMGEGFDEIAISVTLFAVALEERRKLDMRQNAKEMYMLLNKTI